jgi:hypothetical protein
MLETKTTIWPRLIQKTQDKEAFHDEYYYAKALSSNSEDYSDGSNSLSFRINQVSRRYHRNYDLPPKNNYDCYKNKKNNNNNNQ